MSSLWQIRTGIEICFEVHVDTFPRGFTHSDKVLGNNSTIFI